MGLCLAVGFLAGVKVNDPDGYRQHKKSFDAVSECLVDSGLKPHSEPEDLPEHEQFECEMLGYSGLHHLRRLAAYVALKRPLYVPSGELSDEDEVVNEYYSAFDSNDTGDVPFSHLMVHGDSEGYYIPQVFTEIVDPGDRFQLVGGAIGSSHRLLDECKTLAEVIELPITMDIDNEELWDAADDPGSGKSKWQRYGIEAFSCIRLVRACEVSIEKGAAIVFC